MHMSDLQSKDIISTKDGRKIGRITDLVVNEKGEITSLIIEPNKFLKRYSFASEETFITFSEIVKFGDDVILVDLKK